MQTAGAARASPFPRTAYWEQLRVQAVHSPTISIKTTCCKCEIRKPTSPSEASEPLRDPHTQAQLESYPLRFANSDETETDKKYMTYEV